MKNFKRQKQSRINSLKIQKPSKSRTLKAFVLLVPGTGFEPAHPCERCDLNTVRLTISPPGQ